MDGAVAGPKQDVNKHLDEHGPRQPFSKHLNE